MGDMARAQYIEQVRTTQIVRVYAGLYFVDKATSLQLLSPYVPNLNVPSNVVAGFSHRVGTQMPPRTEETKRFLDFAKATVLKKFPQITEGDVPELAEFLDGSHYSSEKCEYFKALRRELNRVSTEEAVAEGFLKDEDYEKFGVPRCIVHPPDKIQTFMMPLVHAIDKAVFRMPWFVKGTDPKTWPERLMNLFGHTPVIETDFTSMEAHHFGVYADFLYFWMLHVARGVHLPCVMRDVLAYWVKGMKRVRFKTQHVKFEILGRLFSGSLWTSSANSVLNFMLMLYASLRVKYPEATNAELLRHVDEFRGVFEGDDGLTEDIGFKDTTIFQDLGVVIKLPERGEAKPFYKSHFCQQVVDIETMKICPNPLRILRKFFALPRNFVSTKDISCKAYLRAKALSYKYLYPDAPVIGPVMDWVLGRTKSLDIRKFVPCVDSYRREFVEKGQSGQVWKSPAIVPPSMRVLMEEVFGLGEVVQRRIEDALDADSDVLSVDLGDLIQDGDFNYVTRFVVPEYMNIRTPVNIGKGERLTKMKCVSRDVVPFEPSIY
jgi:hypothetical protein